GDNPETDLTIGNNQSATDYDKGLRGAIDEVRISTVARYGTESFSALEAPLPGRTATLESIGETCGVGGCAGGVTECAPRLPFAGPGPAASDLLNERSFRFDGINDGIVVEDPGLAGLSHVSVSAWVRSDMPEGTAHALVSHPGFTLFAAQATPHHPRFSVVRGDDTAKTVDGPDWTPEAVGVWHHVVGTYHGPSQEIRVYVDGELAGTNTMNAGADFLTSDPGQLRLGSKHDGSTHFLVGAVDEVSVWTTTLSEGDVSALYGGGTPGDLTQHDAAADLASWWRMGDHPLDDATPDTGVIVDVVGGRHGTPTATVGDEVVDETVANLPISNGKALSLDGVDDLVTVPSDPSLLTGDQLTVSTWVRVDNESSPDKGYRHVVKRADDTQHGFQLLHYGTYKYRFRLRTTGTEGAGLGPAYIEGQLSGGDPGAGQDIRWRHVVGPYDGAHVRLYVDGVEVDAAEREGDILEYAEGEPPPLTIGDLSDHEGDPILQVDELSLWDRGLTPSEVTALYNGGTPTDLVRHGASDHLVSWWRMGDAGGD
ncbi:MAG: LamG domain-containing protein, partial [Myxococcota bacterium]|nr:LamG domain-containing protein [Myxococcota bacterium]